MADLVPFDTCLAALLRERTAQWPSTIDDDAALGRIRFHGVAGLLAEADCIPPEIFAEIQKESRLQAIREDSSRATLVPLLSAFADAGVDAMLLKGARLAYTLYDPPHRRARGDTDLLVRKRHLRRARAILSDRGFARDPGAGDGFYQEQWLGPVEFGQRQAIDLHWAMTNSPAINRALFAEDLFAKACAVPRLGKAARGTDTVTTLLHLALNRAFHMVQGHTVDGTRVIGEARLGWAWDARLLAHSMDEGDWNVLPERASRGGAAVIVDALLIEAKEWLCAPVPPATLEGLRRDVSDPWICRYITGGLSMRLRHDMRALQSVGDGVRLAKAHLAPPEAVLRLRYRDETTPLRWLRLRRIAEAIVGR